MEDKDLAEVIEVLVKTKIEEQGESWASKVTQTDIYNQGIDEAVYKLKLHFKDKTTNH